MTKEFWKNAINRAIRTMCQTAVALLSTNTFITDLNWLSVLSASVLSGIVSILTSISTGLPEAKEGN